MTKLDTAIAALNPGFSGRLIRPGDADYDTARTLVYGGFDKRPGLIARVKTAADVQRAVNAARDAGLELAVRSGGHSNAGYSSTDGGVVIDLRDMAKIEVDAAGKTLWAETGATAIEVTEAAVDHGLIVGFGDAGSVGVGGITLGGGVGYLVRKWGLSIDSLLEAEVVTADGKLLTASAVENSELFWALRGGGGNFGLVTRLKFALHELPAFTGGMMALPATPEVLAGFIAAAEAAPEELSTIANVMPAPPMPFLPAEVHGKIIILAMLAFSGEPDAADRAIAPFRALATPYADFVKAGPYTSIYPPEDPHYHPTAAARTMFMDHVGLADATTMVRELETSDAAMRVVQLRVLGGAFVRVAPDATAFAHRHSRIMVNVAAFWTSPEDRKVREAWIVDMGDKLQQSDSGAYVNFLAKESPERVRAAYPGPTWDRLPAIKATYDPKNLFRLNQNIVPAA